jgi:hypothetical protein
MDGIYTPVISVNESNRSCNLTLTRRKLGTFEQILLSDDFYEDAVGEFAA